jgi:hypothetical protein
MFSLQPLAVYQLVLHPAPPRKGRLPGSPPENPLELLYALITLSDRHYFPYVHLLGRCCLLSEALQDSTARDTRAAFKRGPAARYAL